MMLNTNTIFYYYLYHEIIYLLTAKYFLNITTIIKHQAYIIYVDLTFVNIEALLIISKHYIMK